MAYWDVQDSDYILLRRWLEAARAQNGVANTFDKAWRPLDSENNILAKILRVYCEAYGVSGSNALAYRVNDTENDIYRKVLGVLHVGMAGLPADAEHEWRPGDPDRDLLAKILKCICIDAANTDPQKDFLPLDTETAVLRKIVGIY